MAGNRGMTLEAYLKSKGPLPASQVARLACQVARQMAKEAESAPGNRAPVVHPGRIHVSSSGAVELLPAHDDDVSLPVAAGFPAYASPEEIRGEPGDFRSSLYSLGCTIYELLTGAPPFAGVASTAPSPKDILRAHIKNPVPDPRGLSVGVDDALAETVRELLYKDPELRVQTAGELIRRLKQSTAAGQRAATPGSADEPRSRVGAGGRGRAASSRVGTRTPLPQTQGIHSGRQRSSGSGSGRGTPPRWAPSGAGAERRRAGLGGGRPGGGKLGRGRLGRGSAPSPRERRMSEDDYLDYDDESRVLPRRKKVYPFTYCGLAIGVLLSLVLVVRGLQETREKPPREAAYKAEVARKELDQRKQLFRELTANIDREMEKYLEVAKGFVTDPQRPHPMKIGALEHLMTGAVDEYPVATLPGAVAIAKEIVKLRAQGGLAEEEGGPGAPAGSGSKVGGFEHYRAEFQQLADADRWGEALEKIREAEDDYLTTHGQEIDDLFNNLEKRLVERWEKDQARGKELAQKGEVTEALALFTKAGVYGDYEIKKEAREYIREIEKQALIASEGDQGEAERGGSPAKKEGDTEGFGDLDAEFEKELEKEKKEDDDGDAENDDDL